MPIVVECVCGKRLRAPDGAAGRKARCPQCGATLNVPPAPRPEPVNVTPPARAIPPASSPQPREPRTVPKPQAESNPRLTPGSGVVLHETPRLFQRYLYLVFLLGLIPLVSSTLSGHGESFADELKHTIEAHPEQPDLAQRLKQIIENGSEDQFFAAVPGHRLQGAFLARDSKTHWLMASASAGLFLTALLLMFSAARKHVWGVVLASLFTATIGVLLLLAFQWAADASSGVWIRGGGKLAIIFLIIKFIGFSYSAALNPDAGFILSFLGFTFGVGLCEEGTKALPLLYRLRSDHPDPPTCQHLLVLGLASGIGFGVAEGIMYAGEYYNGMAPVSIYLVRFVSCVVLHAVWSGAVGATLYAKQSWLHDADSGWDYSGNAVLIVAVPMVLHGLYDTLLKQSHGGLALLVALASFGWLAFQIERMYAQEPEVKAQLG